MLTSREKELLKYLYSYKEKQFVSSRYLAKALHVSVRTVKSDIKSLNSYLNDLDNGKTQIISKRGLGYQIKTNDITKIANIIFSDFDESYESRSKYQIAKELIETDQPITIDDLAYRYYISNSVVTKILDSIQDDFVKFELQLVRTPGLGTIIKGMEKNKRLYKSYVVKKLIRSDVFSQYRLNQIKEYFPTIDIFKIEQILLRFEFDHNIVMSEVSKIGLIIHTAIALKRLSDNQKIVLRKEEIDFLKVTKEWKLSIHYCRDIENAFRVELSKDEIGFVTIHLLGSGISNTYNAKELFEINQPIYKEMENVIQEIDSVFNTNFNDDLELKNMLFIHLLPMINRLRFGIQTDNEFIKDVQQDYPFVYEIAVYFSNKLSQLLDLEIYETEISFISMHFGASFERKKVVQTRLNIGIACASGFGTCQFLKEKLRKILGDEHNYEILSIFDAKTLEEKYDVVFTTVKLDSLDNMVLISPVFSKEDEKLVRKYVSSTKKITFDDNPLAVIFERQNVFFNVELNNKNDVYSFFKEKLHLNASSLSSIQKREAMGSTYIGGNVAVPHVLSSTIEKTEIYYISVKNFVEWSNKEQVSVILLLHVSKNDATIFLDFFKTISDILEDESRLDNLKKVDNVDKLNAIFNV